jgi:hypothetical protein
LRVDAPSAAARRAGKKSLTATIRTGRHAVPRAVVLDYRARF